MGILYSTITILLSTQIVLGSIRIQDALMFAVITYVALLLLQYFPIPYLPFVNAIIIVEVVIKSLIAMQIFHTDFRGGISVAGVQILIGMMLVLPF